MGELLDATFEITKGCYSTNFGSSFQEVNGTYTKPTSGRVLLTTGATERNSVLNIYDLAGNELEWTLEKSTDINYPSVSRGGNYDNGGAYHPVSYRINNSTSGSVYGISFRSGLW